MYCKIVSIALLYKVGGQNKISELFELPYKNKYRYLTIVQYQEMTFITRVWERDLGTKMVFKLSAFFL